MKQRWLLSPPRSVHRPPQVLKWLRLHANEMDRDPNRMIPTALRCPVRSNAVSHYNNAVGHASPYRSQVDSDVYRAAEGTQSWRLAHLLGGSRKWSAVVMVLGVSV